MKRRYKAVAAIVLVMLVISVGLNIVLAGNQQADRLRPGPDSQQELCGCRLFAIILQGSIAA